MTTVDQKNASITKLNGFELDQASNFKDQHVALWRKVGHAWEQYGYGPIRLTMQNAQPGDALTLIDPATGQWLPPGSGQQYIQKVDAGSFVLNEPPETNNNS